MDMIQLKIKEDSNMITYIKLIRKFDTTLSIGTLKKKIENNDYVIGFDLEYYDVIEDINGINKKVVFRSLITELCSLDAKFMIYQNGERISLELLDNWLETLNKIEFE